MNSSEESLKISSPGFNRGEQLGHKRILGKTTDFITGREITDTDDERYRQKLAHILIEEKGYTKGDVEVKRRIEMTVDNRKVLSMVDFVVTVDETAFMVIRYGPGSIVTRERPALAAARILAQYQIPCTVVTNGEDAEILDTLTGRSGRNRDCFHSRQICCAATAQ